MTHGLIVIVFMSSFLYPKEALLSGASTGLLEGKYFSLEFTDGMSVTPEDGDYSEIIEQGNQYSDLIKLGLPQFEKIIKNAIDAKQLPIVNYQVTDHIDGIVLEDSGGDKFDSKALLKQKLEALKKSLIKPNEPEVEWPTVSYKQNIYNEEMTVIDGVNSKNKHLLPIVKLQAEMDQLDKITETYFEKSFAESKMESINVWHRHFFKEPLYYQLTLKLSVNKQIKRSDMEQLTQQFEIVITDLLQKHPLD